MYEMVYGSAPFPYVFDAANYDCIKTLESKILRGDWVVADDHTASRRCVDVAFQRLLHVDALSRLGSCEGSCEITEHPWFDACASEDVAGIDWDTMESGDEPAPGFNHQISRVSLHTT